MRNRKTLHLNIYLLFFLFFAVFSCTKGNESFTITGNITGIEEGKKVILFCSEDIGSKPDTTVVHNRNFKFTGSLGVNEPVIYILSFEGRNEYLSFYLENSKISINGNIDSINQVKIKGSNSQDDFRLLTSRLKPLNEKYKAKIDSLYRVIYADLYVIGDPEFRAFYEKKKGNINEIFYYLHKRSINLPLNKQKELDAEYELYKEREEKLNSVFVNEFPKSYISAILVSRAAKGKKIEDINLMINKLDPSLKKYPIISKLINQVEVMKKTEVSMENFIPNAHNLSYTVEKTYKGADHKNVIYLAVISNDNVCALTVEGNILVINPAGAKVAEFKSNLTSKPAVIAVDKTDNIYVLGGKSEEKTIEVRGRSVKQNTPVGVECLVLNSKGAKVREIALEGVISVTGVRISEDNLLIADTRGHLINIYNVETGEKKATIGNLRTCCGILDFGVRNNNEVLVANLGAFRVNGFDYAGNATISFGERGTDLNQFHGCCNPVSVAFLSNGGIVTVEKDPTRIKVYSNEGAKKIEGIDELVKGCAYIPMAVDTKDNVYLASKASGLVKCVPTK